jgi:nicotinate-nucleotide adenylyltransferase
LKTLTRIGVFGGTFDPIHIGHLIIATEMKHALGLEHVLFVLAARPPHKSEQEISENQHRLAMLQLALEGNQTFEVSELELNRPGSSYTADTLEALSLDFPRAKLIFLMGEDSLRDLPQWHDPDRIVQLAEIAVAARPGIDVDVGSIHKAIAGSAGRIHLVETPEIGISARDIRERVASGKPIAYQVPYKVEEYIRANGLYLECDRSR